MFDFTILYTRKGNVKQLLNKKAQKGEEDNMKNEMNCAKSAADEARERVEEELSDLCEKMSKLTVFLYGNGRVKANLSDNMIKLMKRQLDIMKSYATTLQTRLSIW